MFTRLLPFKACLVLLCGVLLSQVAQTETQAHALAKSSLIENIYFSWFVAQVKKPQANPFSRMLYA